MSSYSSSEPQSKRPDLCVTPFGAERGHVQSIPDEGAASPDGSDTHEKSAVVIEGSDAHQGRNLLSVELSQFREGRCGGDSDADNLGLC